MSKFEKEAIEGRITISKPYGPDDRYISIEIEDPKAATRFLEIRMSLENFADAVTGMGSVRMKFLPRNLSRVSKIHEHKELVFEIPPEKTRCAGGREWAEANCQKFADKGWIADDYFRSQNSFFVKEGKTYARGIQRRYVDPPAKEDVEEHA